MNDMFFSHSDQWYYPDEEEPEVYCPHCGSKNPDTIFRVDYDIRCSECVDVISDWGDICRILKEVS